MATLDWQLTDAGDATLVELVVTSDTDTGIELTSNLTPVWPPRRHSRPAAGWNENGYEGSVTAETPLVLGYASPADPVEPPATVAATGPVSNGRDGSPTPAELVRSLGEAGPPRDAVPTPTAPSTGADWPSATLPSEESGPDDTGVSDHRAERSGPEDGMGVTEGDRATADAPPAPAVDPWLDALERRLDAAERLGAVETADEARAAVDAVGGIDAVRRLCARLDADRTRCDRLAGVDDRLDAVEVPLSALERLV